MSPFVTSVSRNRWLRTLAVCLLLAALLTVGVQHFNKNKKPVIPFSAAHFRQQALAMVSTFGDPIQEMSEPVQDTPDTWAMTCSSQNLDIDLSFYADTGHLCQLGIVIKSDTNLEPVAPVDTPAQAGEVALHRLRDLHLVPPGASLTLVHPPYTASRTRTGWGMIWLVTGPQIPQPYRITFVLDRATGLPVCIWDKCDARTLEPTPPPARPMALARSARL